MRRQSVRQHRGLVVPALPLAPAGERDGHQTAPFTRDVERPPEARHVVRHPIGRPRPAIVLERVHELAGDAAPLHPGDRADRTNEWRQCITPSAGVASDGVRRFRMAATGTLRLGQALNATPAEQAHGAALGAQRRGANRADTWQCEFEQRPREPSPSPPPVLDDAADHAAGRSADGFATASHITARSGSMSPNHRCHDRAPCAISMRSPSSARRPWDRASCTNGVGPVRR